MPLKRDGLGVIAPPSTWVTTSFNSGSKRLRLLLTFHHVVLLLLLGGLLAIRGPTAKINLNLSNKVST